MAVILSTQSCCHKLYPHTTEVTEKTESVTETIRDTIIMVQPDSTIMQALIQCDSTGRAFTFSSIYLLHEDSSKAGNATRAYSNIRFIFFLLKVPPF